MKGYGLVDSLDWVDRIDVPDHIKVTIVLAIKPYISKHPSDHHDLANCLKDFPWSRSCLGQMI
jgi:hypothetical protein